MGSKCLFLFALVASACGPLEEAPVASTRAAVNVVNQPNILLIIADDIGVEQAQFDRQSPCYSAGPKREDAPMPNLSALCEEGVMFRNAWAMPTCSPTRASIMTGTWPHQHGVGQPVDGSSVELDPQGWTLPRALDGENAGYDMASFGKWHLTTGLDDPRQMGWHDYAGVLNGAVSQYDSWTRTEDGYQTISQDYVTTANVDDAVRWLQGRGDAPWLMWLATTAPHTPFHLPPLDLHSKGDLGDYDPMGGDDPDPWYDAAVEALDTELGRLFDEVKARGDWDNTVVIFIGDNGSPASVVGRPFTRKKAKGTLYEGGVNVPFIVRGPGVVGGRSSRALVSVTDLFSTILELAGQDPETARQNQAPHVSLASESLVPILEDSRQSVRPYVLSELFGSNINPAKGGFTIRDRDYKLTCLEDGAVRLYDMDQDRWERSDRYEDGVGPDAGFELIYEDLRDELRAETGDPGLCD